MNKTTDELNDFFKMHEKKAFYIALMATYSRDDALDVVQEAMIKLANKYGNKDSKEWQPLFYRILNRVISDHYRKQKTWQNLKKWFQIDTEIKQSLSEELIESNCVETGENIRDKEILNAIQQLPFRQQQVFILRSWQEYSVEETANILVCSPGTVKQHYHRAIKRLQELLKEYRYEQ